MCVGNTDSQNHLREKFMVSEYSQCPSALPVIVENVVVLTQYVEGTGT